MGISLEGNTKDSTGSVSKRVVCWFCWFSLVWFDSLATVKYTPPVKVTLGCPILITDITIYPIAEVNPRSHM